MQHAPGAKRGALAGFVDMLIKRGADRRTLFNHKAIATEFYEKMGWLSDKGKLTDQEQPQALLSAQLDLFTDPEAQKRQDAIGEAVRFIGNNGVRDLLKMIAADHAENKTSGQTFGGKLGNENASLTPEQVRANLMEEAKDTIKGFAVWAQTDVFYGADTKGNRKTLAEVAKMKSPAQTLSLLVDEEVTLALKTCEQVIASLKWIGAQRKGKAVHLRKGKGPHS